MSDNYTDFDDWWEEFKVGRNDVQLFSLKCAAKCAWDAAVTKCALDVVVNSEQPFGDIPCTIKMPAGTGEEVTAKGNKAWIENIRERVDEKNAPIKLKLKLDPRFVTYNHVALHKSFADE